MRRLLAGAARVEADPGREDLDGDPRVGDDGAAESHAGEIGDADLVGLGDRPDRPAPPAVEIERTSLLERREQTPDAGVLLLYREGAHLTIRRQRSRGRRRRRGARYGRSRIPPGSAPASTGSR
jgi:hypothetical protein